MKLAYRGVNYNHEFQPMDVVESEVCGKYRGQDCHFHYPRHIPVPQPHGNLKYRAVSYSVGEPRDQNTMMVAVATSDAKPEPPPATSGDTCAIAPEELAKVHSANLCRLLERRQKAARERGDQRLLSLLEAEAQHIAC
ncbi:MULTISPECIES: DUF4278 domain-containing protein [Oscillatoriales]|jgi:hypothetical protein|nr:MULTISPECIES: DUF4278 domain-containing protein [Oscillatoriales]AMW30098.1 hypothetical protein AP285_21400 [Arthrospira platensis YZ]EKD07749.1 hypothetical protein SPLC1_S360010 [Arthrospira platensis C1]KDR54042.1 hypothetical protein APPUASWS_031335 [Arthrospira platensis str. Paraca]MBD2671421.1 DUF4278 domain-containing protein [Arthrospira platensis FACHB-439]MBD2709081.1 DUF4278 domain-containing protein [Arthrospira platensis FACHB-835]MDF2208022.1 DUF4278 domain-containing prote